MSDQKSSHVNFPDSQSLNGLLLERVMNHASDAIVLTNPEDVVTAWNSAAEKLFGYSASEVIGQSIMLIIDPHILRGVRTISNETDHISCRQADGKSIQVSLRLAEVVDGDNNLLAFCYLFTDQRDNASQQEVIKEKERAVESFMYSVSHDLRAPLRRIINYAEILEEDHLPSLDEEVKRLVTRMAKNAEKMSDLIEDLLSYSRVSQQAIKKSMVNVESLVNNVVAELKNLPDPGRINFSIKSMTPAEADPALLKRVFENLLSNAVKFSRTKETSIIEIGCESRLDSTNYYVRDNGVGFDLQYASKLFNIFQRLHSPSEYEGTGIGLAIVHQIIARHGGKIWAEGKVNEGAVFYFSLPK
jgi:PAS domain S-box-containing protein